MNTQDNRPLAQQKPCGGFKRTISRGRKLSAIKYKEYCYWGNMATRCNNTNYSDKYPTYQEATMSTGFKDYNYFVEWCRSQPEFFKDFWVLDKDILVPNNKVYSENTCCFIPPQINGFLTMRKSFVRDLPTGVSWCHSEGKYKTCCANLDGKNMTVGRFSDSETAFDAYVKTKNELARYLADIWEGEVSQNVTTILRNFDVRDYLVD